MIIAAIIVLWLGWISFEVVSIKSDNTVELSVVKVVGDLNTEVERSKIKDARGERSQQIQWKQIGDLKDRVKTLEIKEGLNH